MGGTRRRGDAGAIVLAAGASVRFGGSPKALLAVDGEPAVVRIVRQLGEVGTLPPVVVTGAEVAGIRAVLAGGPARVVENPAWAAGRTGSVQAGLSVLGSGDPIVLWPVDHPFVEAKTVRGLLDAARTDPVSVWFIPSYRGRSGHPVAFRASVVPRLRALSPAEPLRAVLAPLGAGVRRIASDDPGVLANVDTPEAFERARAERAARGGR